jgi:glutaredoxin/uncharacterized membrane protein
LKYIRYKVYIVPGNWHARRVEKEMQDRRQAYKKIFSAVSVLATIFVLAEIIMRSFGKSICQAEGCKVVAQYVRYGDISILLIGLVTFTVLTIVSFLDLDRNNTSAGPFINLVLIVSLACEGFFTGYQAFSIHTPCLFCLIIFAFIAVLGIIRLLAGEREIIAGLMSLVAVFSMLYLVLPAGVLVELPATDRFILFFSKDCKHCAEVIKNLEEKKIEVKHVEVNAYSAFLKSMGIDTVPTLMVNAQNQRLFISGKDAILRYLLACTLPLKTGADKVPLTKRGAAVIPSQPGTDIFNQPAVLTGPMSSDEDGMCKQGDVCK